jgi:hypothetical protein
MRQSRSSGRQADGRIVGLMLAAVAVLAAGPAGRLSAQSTPQNYGALFLLFPVGAQSVGMGQTAAALEGRGEVVFLNPAGVGALTTSEFALHSARLAAGATNALTAFFPRRGVGVFGVALDLVDYGDQEVNDSNGPPSPASPPQHRSARHVCHPTHRRLRARREL